MEPPLIRERGVSARRGSASAMAGRRTEGCEALSTWRRSGRSWVHQAMGEGIKLDSLNHLFTCHRLMIMTMININYQWESLVNDGSCLNKLDNDCE